MKMRLCNCKAADRLAETGSCEIAGRQLFTNEHVGRAPGAVPLGISSGNHLEFLIREGVALFLLSLIGKLATLLLYERRASRSPRTHLDLLLFDQAVAEPHALRNRSYRRWRP